MYAALQLSSAYETIQTCEESVLLLFLSFSFSLISSTINRNSVEEGEEKFVK